MHCGDCGAMYCALEWMAVNGGLGDESIGHSPAASITRFFLPIIPFHMHQVVVWQMMFFVNNIFRIKMLLTWNYLTITSSLTSISISSCSLVVTKIDFFVYSQLKFWHHYVTLNSTQLILSCNIIFFSGMKTFSTK